jgi:endonuclease/exonuclease/phosphatase family metal-dependent hydrolase
MMSTTSSSLLGACSPDFTLLSLNAFGVPFFLSLGRLGRLARALNHLEPQVICLQEVQQHAYIPLLQRSLSGHPHQAFFLNPRGYAPKGGLLTASSLPVGRAGFSPFPQRGHPWSIGFSDWALYKGVLMAELEWQGQQIIILNTHLHANYSGDWRPENGFARLQYAQIQFLATLVQVQPPEALVILCGDFNFPRTCWLYTELVRQGDLVDPLADDPRPSYRPFPLVSSRWSLRLDFVLYRLPQGQDLDIKADILPLDHAPARSRFHQFLTDHCALTLSVRGKNEPVVAASKK